MGTPLHISVLSKYKKNITVFNILSVPFIHNKLILYTATDILFKHKLCLVRNFPFYQETQYIALLDFNKG